MDWNEIPLTVRKNLGRMVKQSVLHGRNCDGFRAIIPDGKDSQGIQCIRKRIKFPTICEKLDFINVSR
uniref:hypothetical protein n=1 Tax=Heyndrickxia sp. FSL K6-6286 TaxID=2921510 RepID=UPI00406C1E06